MSLINRAESFGLFELVAASTFSSLTVIFVSVQTERAVGVAG